MLPFTTEQFLAVFASYNEAIWPVHLAAYGLGLIAIGAVAFPGPQTHHLIFTVLGLFWIGNGAGYHLWQLTAITPAAWLFGTAFLVQGALFLRQATSGAPFGLRFGSEPRRLVGGALIAYAAIVYPLVGPAFGHAWPRAPYFGVAPCPTTIFTFGLLLLAERERITPGLLVIPFAWSLVGGSAAVLLGITEDLGLVVAGGLGAFLLFCGRAGDDRIPLVPRWRPGPRQRYPS